MENISYYLEEMQFLIKPKRENWKTEFESRNLTDWSNVEIFGWRIDRDGRSWQRRMTGRKKKSASGGRWTVVIEVDLASG